MEFIAGENREQISMLPNCLDDYVGEENTVRVIDAFVESLDMEGLGFEKSVPNDTGRPMYNPKDLLKLYIYGYMNRIRSSRSLEKETHRNLEVIWLLRKLTPDHKTIARFRQQNPLALKNVFRHFVQLCCGLDLYGRELIAVDGSKFKAWNTKDRNFTKGKISDRIRRLNDKIEQYMEELEQEDTAENVARTDAHSAKAEDSLRQLTERRTILENYQEQLKSGDDTQISLTDPDSRLMKTKGGLDVCLNVQTAVDSKNKMIVEFEVTNQAQDKNMLTPMAEKTSEILAAPSLTFVADNGYDSVSDVAQVLAAGHTPIVAGGTYEFCFPASTQEAEQITEYDPEVARSVFLPERNVFVCPMGHMLHPTCYHRTKHVAKYINGAACSKCTQKCTTSRYYTAERLMKPSDFRREYDDSPVPLKKVWISQNKAVVQQRKCIVEHPFGTVKRNMGISYLLLRGIGKARGEISLAFLAYNLKRAIQILGVNKLIHSFQI